MFPSDFAACDEPIRYMLLAALRWVRQAEISDALVGLLVDLLHRINVVDLRPQPSGTGRGTIAGHRLGKGAGPRSPRCIRRDNARNSG